MRKNEMVRELEKFGLQAKWETVNKNGVLHTGIVMKSQGEMVAPIIYTDGLIDENDSLDRAVSKILAQYQKVKTENLDLNQIISREYVLDHITIAVQKDGIEEIVKRESGLFGIEAYLIVIDSSPARNMSMKVSKELLKRCQVSECEAWERAEKNLHESIKIQSMSDVMTQLMGAEFTERAVVDDMLYIISTKSGVKGASAVLDSDTMKEFARKHQTRRITVLPSSIHEMLLIPNTGGFNEAELSEMVKSVNETEVIPEERLTDRVYVLEF